MIDIKQLEPGTTISVAALEAHTGEKYGSEAYGLAILNLRNEIGETIECFVRRRKGTLVVLGPIDGAVYGFMRSSGAMKNLASVNRRLVAWINENDLDPETRQRYRHQLKINSQVLQLYTTQRQKQREKERLFSKKQQPKPDTDAV